MITAVKRQRRKEIRFVERGISRELGQLRDWAQNFSDPTLPRRYSWVLWSDGMTRDSLRSLGMQPPAPRSNNLIGPTVLLLSLAIPAEAASAFLIHTIDAQSGKAISGVKVKTNGHLLGTTDPKGDLQTDTKDSKISLSKEGYHPLVLPTSQLLEENILVLSPLRKPTAKPTVMPTMKRTVVPTMKPTMMPTMRPTVVPTMKPTAAPTMRPILPPTTRPIPVPTAKPVPTAVPTPVTAVTPRPSISLPSAKPQEIKKAEVPHKGETYLVRRGDSLYLIAWRLLGDPERWPELYQLNKGKIENPHRIFPGLRLILPSGRPHHYRVAVGDTLWGIAQRQLGDGSRWKEIYQINRPLIPNPHWILPNQELLLPG